MKINTTSGTFKQENNNQWISYTGKLITMRDSSSKKLFEMYKNKQKLPLDLKSKVILYAAPTKSEKIIIGPTTSIRMDIYLDFLYKQGVVATIGKGKRSPEAYCFIENNNFPYFILMSGVSAYLSKFFKSKKIIAFEELGAEAIFELEVENLPLLK